MSALAKICLNRGKFISGSDKVKTHITEELTHLGANIFYKHNKKNLQDADLVIYTCAVGEKNIEVVTAKNLGIKTLERAEFLGEIAKEYENVISVAGSHGKTTVCGMLQNIFDEANLKPTLLVGGETPTGNLILGEKKYLIVEACEYKEHFLKLPTTCAVIINIDYDHPDYFKTQFDYEKAFEKFANNSTKLFINENYAILLNITNKDYITFGNNGNFKARHIEYKDNIMQFDVYKLNKFFGKYIIKCIGSHNITNALCAISIADYYSIDKKIIKKGLAKFENLKRRFEYMGKINNNIVITDYAHHPTQIVNAINSTKEIYSKKITVVFEPHTYSRTKALFGDFINALKLADNVIILPTYSAREKSKKGGTSRDLYEALKITNKNVCFVKSYKKCKKELEKINDNIILLLGAGTIINLAENIKHEYLKCIT